MFSIIFGGYLFIYLASWSLSRGMWDLPHCIVQDLSMRHTESVVVMLAQWLWQAGTLVLACRFSCNLSCRILVPLCRD